AIDQYERTLAAAQPKLRPIRDNALSGVFIPPDRWSGRMNPNIDDTQPVAIRFFQGVGRDGDGDGQASRHQDADLLYSIAAEILRFGSAEEDASIGLWEYYQNTRAVQR